MNDHEGDYRAFTHFNEAWYRDANLPCMGANFVDEVMIGWYCPGGGTSGEFGIRWKNIGNEPTPQIQMFGDSWDLLSSMRDLFDELAKLDGMNIKPKELCGLLLNLGFEDRTSRSNPYLKTN